jgi:hypothetical protein
MLQNVFILTELQTPFGELGWRSRYSDWLRVGRPRGRSSSLGRVKNLLYVVQIGSGVHTISTGGPFPGGKAAEA